jgi:peptidyl-prolyl cis-trans isomerase SurA
MNLKNVTFCILIIFFYIQNLCAVENKILFKIENELITSIDIYNQSKYLRSINQEMKNLMNDEIFEISKNSIIREKIKKINILENNIELRVEDEILDSFIKLIFSSKKINNLEDYKKYVNSLDISFDTMKEKLIIELLWNNLIFKKFSSRIKINKTELKKEIQKKDSTLTSYLLYEIMFNASSKSELNEKYKKIKNDIDKQGFKKSALIHSISESVNSGGDLGWVNENSLNKKIVKNILDLTVGDYTKPISIPGGFLLLMIKDKKQIKKEIDIEKELNYLIRIKTNQQLNQFSRMYYNKIKKNLTINEL